MAARELSLREWIRSSHLPRLEVLALAQHSNQHSREWWVAREADPLHTLVCAESLATLHDLIERRAAGEPLAYLIGWCEFYGRRFAVSPATLIPRADTELLVEAALTVLKHTVSPAANPRVIDLGTGSGCIAITLAAEYPQAHVWATERSTAALDIARKNAAQILGPQHQLTFASAKDWFDTTAPFNPATFDLIVSNPPYIAATDPHLDQGDLRFEPRTALTDEATGLGCIQAILSGAAASTSASAARLPTILMEHGWDQGLSARRLAAQYGWEYTSTLRDSQGHERVLVASASKAPILALEASFATDTSHSAHSD
jgi:release factor glutamine methyltransferase